MSHVGTLTGPAEEPSKELAEASFFLINLLFCKTVSSI